MLLDLEQSVSTLVDTNIELEEIQIIYIMHIPQT